MFTRDVIGRTCSARVPERFVATGEMQSSHLIDRTAKCRQMLAFCVLR